MPAQTRTRRRRAASTDSVAATQQLVSELIKENRRLRRENDRLKASAGTAKRGPRGKSSAEKALTAIQRQVQRALGAAPTATRSRRRTTSTATRTRKPVSPEVRERRLAALAKAREVRAQKRAAAS